MLAETLDPWTNSSANKGGFYDTGRISGACVRVCTCARAHRGRGTEVEWMEAGSWSSGPALLASTRRGADFITHASLSPLHGLFSFLFRARRPRRRLFTASFVRTRRAPTTETPSFLNTPQLDLMCAGQSAADLSPLIPLMLVLIVRLLLIGCRLLFKTDDFLKIISLFSKRATLSPHVQLKVFASTLPEAEGRVFSTQWGFSTLSLRGGKKRRKRCRLPSSWPAAGLTAEASSVLQLVNAPGTAGYTVRGQRWRAGNSAFRQTRLPVRHPAWFATWFYWRIQNNQPSCTWTCKLQETKCSWKKFRLHEFSSW